MRTWIALLACLAACTPVGEPEPEENNDRVYGGGEVIVTFTLDEGVGFDGSITVAGSTAAEIQADGLRNATGLHVYEWDVPEETARNRFTINVVGEDITDDSGLTNTFSCDADLSTFHTEFEHSVSSPDVDELAHWVDVGGINAYRGEPDSDYRSPVGPLLEETGSLTIPINWNVLGDHCPQEVEIGAGHIGSGSVTFDWAFDPSETYTPEGQYP